jgi:hypothetical protein
MGYTLNVDHWDWVDPESQKVIRLRKGEEGVDADELSKGWRPLFLSNEDVRESGAQIESARTSGADAGVRSTSPKAAESK